MKGNHSGRELYPCCSHKSSILTIQSRNCLKNGALCGYPTLSMDMSDPSGSAPLDSMSLASPSTSATASMSFPLDILHSQRAVQPMSGFNNPESEVLLWHSSTRQLQPCASTPLPATRTDPFNTLPLELSPKSQAMLDHCESDADKLSLGATAQFSLTTPGCD
jgi:hypothetical protein